MRPLRSFEGMFLCMGGSLREDHYFGSTQKRCWILVNHCFICNNREKVVNHTCLYMVGNPRTSASFLLSFLTSFGCAPFIFERVLKILTL